MSQKICLFFAMMACLSLGQIFAQDVMSSEISLNSASLMSGEGYIPLYESELYLNAAYDDNFLKDATTVQTGPENVLMMIVALLLAIFLYKKYSPFTEK